MKRRKVFQRNNYDCARAAFATLLNIPYESGPPIGKGLDANYLLFPNGKIQVTDSSIDAWMHKHKLRWGKGIKGRFYNPWKFYLGVVESGRVFGDRNEAHVVVMCGHRIWHDPDRNTEIPPYKHKDVTYSIRIIKIPEATP